MALRKLKEFSTPKTGDEVVSLLTKGDEALVLAGGTFLHGLEARGLLSDAEVLVDIRKLGLNKITDTNGQLNFGATVTYADIKANSEVQSAAWLAGLADSLESPPVQVRNTATVGGCVAASCPFFDIPTAFVSLDAIVSVKGPEGDRQLPLTEFFTGLFSNALEAGEFVTGVSIPRVAGKSGAAFIKLEGNANDLAIVNTAVRVTVDAQGVCTEARVSLGGGVAESAVRSPAAEAVLMGSKLDAAALKAAGDAVDADIDPMSDHRASAEYRRAVAKVLVRRALERAVARLG